MNISSILKTVAVAGMVSVALTSVASAQTRVHAPLGFQLMCLKNPSQCEAGGASSIAATNDVMAKIRRVNVAVNNSITPKADGRIDVWTVNASAGDCEEYVLAKRAALIKEGLPSSSLRIAYVKANGVGHAILVVKTDNGDFVLDNLSSAVRPLARSGYRIIEEMSADPDVWT